MSEKLNINIHLPGEKTETLRCNWCGEDHAVELAYKQDIIARGVLALDEIAKQIEDMDDGPDKTAAEAQFADVVPEDTWMCGRCLLVANKLAPDAMKTECHDHEVPEERVPK